MAMCSCDGPPHPYDPQWCRAGIVPTNGATREWPMRPTVPVGAETIGLPDHRARPTTRREWAIDQARIWIDRLERDAHWARNPQIRDEANNQIDILKALIT